jgi:hypothetical protein
LVEGVGGARDEGSVDVAVGQGGGEEGGGESEGEGEGFHGWELNRGFWYGERGSEVCW